MHRLLIAMALLFVAPLATAQVYKWTDAGGTVHYAQQPPAEGTKYQLVKTTGTAEPRVAPAPSSPAGESTEPMPEPTAPLSDTPQNRSKLCESLKANLAALQGSGPVVMQQNGKATALDAEQRKQQTSTAQTQYQQYCQSQQ
jgi:hypothetical protein